MALALRQLGHLRDSALGLRDLPDLLGEHSLEDFRPADPGGGLRRFAVDYTPADRDAGRRRSLGLLADRPWFCSFHIRRFALAIQEPRGASDHWQKPIRVTFGEDKYTRAVRVWSCVSWKNSMCYGPLVTEAS